MAISATAEPGGYPPRHRVDISGIGSANATVRLTRITVDGATAVVRSRVRLVSGAGFGYDEEAPYGEPVSYRGEVQAEDGSWVSLSFYGGDDATGPVTLDVPDVWAVHPLMRSLSLRLPLWSPDSLHLGDRSFAESSSPSASAELDVLNRDFPIVQRVGRRRREASSITVHTYTAAEADAVRQLVEDDSSVLIVMAASVMPGRVSYQWVLFGEYDVDWVDEYGGDARAIWTLPFRRVGIPFGDVAPARQWGDLAETFATWGDVGRAYATWGDVEADVRLVS